MTVASIAADDGVLQDQIEKAFVADAFIHEDMIGTGRIGHIIEDAAVGIDLQHKNVAFRVHTIIHPGVAVAAHRLE